MANIINEIKFDSRHVSYGCDDELTKEARESWDVPLTWGCAIEEKTNEMIG